MGSEKILIVEPETMFANEIRDKLLALGYPGTDVARTAEEAMQKSEEIHPDQSAFMDSLTTKPFGYLVKPVNDHDLSSAIETVLFTC